MRQMTASRGRRRPDVWDCVEWTRDGSAVRTAMINRALAVQPCIRQCPVRCRPTAGRPPRRIAQAVIRGRQSAARRLSRYGPFIVRSPIYKHVSAGSVIASTKDVPSRPGAINLPPSAASASYAEFYACMCPVYTARHSKIRIKLNIQTRIWAIRHSQGGAAVQVPWAPQG